MTGGIESSMAEFTISSDADTKVIRISGGTGWNNGGSIVVYGKTHSTNPGDFCIKAGNGTNGYILLGKPDGTLTWGGKDLLRNFSTIHGETGVLHLSNEILFQWGYMHVEPNRTYLPTFYAPFTGGAYLVIPVLESTDISAGGISYNEITSSGFTLKTGAIPANSLVRWLAIGRYV
jgi:hypothetical protein